ncbi:MAG: response regulator transcription factor [Armatimonadota bacterium]|nr:response regulator transcription factor [Armatimonadota bacterium]
MINVLLVEDQYLVRSGVRVLLDRESDICVVGEAADGEEAVRMASELKPDLVLMDIRLPKMDGIEATRHIKTAHNDVEVLVLSAYEDDESVFQAIQAGASGYVLKDITPTNLIRAIRAVRSGMSTVHPGITRRLLDRISLMSRSRAPGGAPLHSDGLTDRELEILVELAKGASSREMAARLYVSESTVKSHLRAIYRKIGARGRSQAVAYAIRKGLVR